MIIFPFEINSELYTLNYLICFKVLGTYVEYVFELFILKSKKSRWKMENYEFVNILLSITNWNIVKPEAGGMFDMYYFHNSFEFTLTMLVINFDLNLTRGRRGGSK